MSSSKAMTNLTISIDDELLKKAWMLAMAEGTSINASTQYQQVTDAILAIAKRAKATSEEPRWARDGAYGR